MTRRLLRRFRRDSSAVSLVEFALGLPLLLGFMLSGLEMANYILASTVTQRLATMSANLVGQAGVGDIEMSEAQFYDLFDAIDSAARPLDMRKNGRLILSVVQGVKQSDNSVVNQYADATYGQQFDGNYTAAVPVLGCHTSQPLPQMSRVLPAGEIMAHAQVTYLYRPLFSRTVFDYFHVPTVITRTADFRMRKNKFQITNDGNHPAKNNCSSADGL